MGQLRDTACRFTAALFISTTLTAPPLVAQAQSADKWGAHLDLEGKIGTQRNLGEGDLFLPLAQSDSSLVFGDLRMRFDDNESHEANVGAGARYMLPSGWNIGGYGYFDRRESGYDNYFNQLTFGAEALGRDFDLRLNGYWAIGERSRAVDSLSAAELSGASITVRGGEERSMSGFDAEVGWRVPLFDAEAPRQLRLYAGGYRFTADGVDDVTGPRLRADFTIDELPFLWEGSRLSIGAEWQHDDPRGSQAFAGLRLRIPLQREDKASPLSAQERRMTDTVIRDIDVVTQAGAFGAPEAATAAAGGGALSVLDSGSVTGANLQTALNNAGANSTVVIVGEFATTATMTLQPGQTVMGRGSFAVQTASGKTASVATPGGSIVNSQMGNTAAVSMADESTISGMTVVHNDPADMFSNPLGIIADGVQNVTIVNNTVRAESSTAATAFGIRAINGATNVNVIGNTVTINGAANAVGIQVVGSEARVAGNTISATGASNSYAISLVNLSGDPQILSGSTDNVRVNGGCNTNSLVGTVAPISFTDGSTCP